MARIWRASEDLGGAEVAKGVAGNVSPVLAGFSLAAIATVLTTKPEERPPLADEAVAALTVCAVLLLAAMQLGFQSLRFEVSPAQRLEWNPEATADREHLRAARQAHNIDVVMSVAYAERFRLVYNLALVAFLAGLSLLTFPADWDGAVAVAFVASASATLGQLAWMLRVRGLRRPSVPGLLPSRAKVKALVAPPSELESWQIATVLHDRVGADPEAGPAVGRLRLGDEFSIELRRNR